MAENTLLIVVTRMHAERGSAGDEFVTEWRQPQICNSMKYDFSEDSDIASMGSTILLLVHGCADLWSGSVCHALEETIGKALREEGVCLTGWTKVFLYVHAQPPQGSDGFLPVHFVGTGLEQATLVVHQYSGGNNYASPQLVHQMKLDGLAQEITEKIEVLIDPRIAATYLLRDLQGLLLCLWVDGAVVSGEVGTPERETNDAARIEMEDTYSKLLAHLRDSLWERFSWKDNNGNDPAILTLRPNRDGRGTLKCWDEFWRLKGEKERNTAVAKLAEGIHPKFGDWEEDVIAIARSIDEGLANLGSPASLLERGK